MLRTLVNALAPGGVLVAEDWDMTWRTGRVLRTPSEADKALFELFHDTLTNVYAAAGADPGWASKVPQVMVDAGLVNVDAILSPRATPESFVDDVTRRCWASKLTPLESITITLLDGPDLSQPGRPIQQRRVFPTKHDTADMTSRYGPRP